MNIFVFLCVIDNETIVIDNEVISILIFEILHVIGVYLWQIGGTDSRNIKHLGLPINTKNSSGVVRL